MRAFLIGIIISPIKDGYQLIYFYKNYFTMWTIIKDCGKQLTIHSKLREKVDAVYKVYDLTERIVPTTTNTNFPSKKKVQNTSY